MSIADELRRDAEAALKGGGIYYSGQHLSGIAERVETLADERAKLRELVNSYADLFEKKAAMNNGHGPYYSGEDWLVLANDMRIELAKCCGELGIEVE